MNVYTTYIIILCLSYLLGDTSDKMKNSGKRMINTSKINKFSHFIFDVIGMMYV